MYISNNTEYVGNKKTLRAKEVATQYGIGLSTVWYYSKQGLITPIKVSQRVTVFCTKELDNFFGYVA